MGGIVRAIAAAMKAAFASMARWCAKTGTWVYDRVMVPAVEFAGGSLAAVAAVPQAIATGLAGSRGMPAPVPRNGHQADSSSEIAEVMEGIEARRGARETLRSMRRHSPVSYEADLVHRYAAADTDERANLDLDELPPHLADWLDGLTEQQLAHLAQSVDICEQAVSGRRTGMVGMPVPVRPTIAAAEEYRAGTVGTIGQVIGDPSAFAARVAAAKGVRRDRQPH